MPLSSLGSSPTPRGPTGSRSGLVRSRSQRLLVTLFGDYWDRDQPPLPSAGLVRVLEEFAITPANARATLSRMTRRELLHRTREGRRTRYAMTPAAWRILVRGARRIFADEEDPAWDGTWTLVVFSVPGDDGDLRRLLRARLRWLTFWPLYDGSWVAPHDRTEAAREQLDDLGVSDAVVVRTDDLDLRPTATTRLEEAWDLPGLVAGYERLLERAMPLAARARAGRVGPAEALVERTELVDAWRRLVRDDPDLPSELLPTPFPRPEARRTFLEIYRTLEMPARARFATLMTDTA